MESNYNGGKKYMWQKSNDQSRYQIQNELREDQHGLKWPKKAPSRGWNSKEGFAKRRILLIEQE